MTFHIKGFCNSINTSLRLACAACGAKLLSRVSAVPVEGAPGNVIRFEFEIKLPE